MVPYSGSHRGLCTLMIGQYESKAHLKWVKFISQGSGTLQTAASVFTAMLDDPLRHLEVVELKTRNPELNSPWKRAWVAGDKQSYKKKRLTVTLSPVASSTSSKPSRAAVVRDRQAHSTEVKCVSAACEIHGLQAQPVERNLANMQWSSTHRSWELVEGLEDSVKKTSPVNTKRQRKIAKASIRLDEELYAIRGRGAHVSRFL